MSCGRVVVTRPDTSTVTVRKESTASQVASKTNTPVVKDSNQTIKVRDERTAVSKNSETQTAQVIARGPQGPKGDPGEDAHMIGPPGPPGKDGQIRFTGFGAPGTIVGSEPGDTYMDLATGDVYKLT